MALVAKTNQTRSTVAIVLLVAVILGASVFLLRGQLFPSGPSATNTGTTPGSVRALPTYPTTGEEALNSNTAQALTPHGDAVLVPCPGRDNPFEPIAGSQGCPR